MVTGSGEHVVPVAARGRPGLVTASSLRSSERARWVVPLAVAVAALGLVLPGVMPGVGFWDTAEFQTVGPLLGTAHPTGYPSYVILGWLASAILTPIGEPAFRMNVLSAILVAATAGLTVVLVRWMTGSSIIAGAAGLGLAATPLVLRLGTHADPHVLHLALLALLILLLVGWERRRRAGASGADRWLVGAAAVFGVAAANHSLTLLLPPAIGLYVLAVDPGIVRRPRLIAACVVALVGALALLYLELPLRAGPFRAPLVYGNPATLDGFWYVVLAEQFRGSIVDPFGNLGGKLAELGALAGAQFGPIALAIPIGFLATVRREPRVALLTGVVMAVTVFFAASYVNADIERYYLGPVLIAWIWLGVLASTIVEQLTGVDAADPDGARLAPARAVVALVLAALLLAPGALSLPDRTRVADRSTDTAAQVWLDRAVAALEPDAVVVSWWSYSTTLWYGQHIEGRLPGVFIVDDRTRLDENLGEVTDVIDRYLGTRPVYVIRPENEIQALAARYELKPTTGPANLWRVAGRAAAAAMSADARTGSTAPARP